MISALGCSKNCLVTESVRKCLGKSLENLWKILGKSWENPWKVLGNPWKVLEGLGKVSENLGDLDELCSKTIVLSFPGEQVNDLEDKSGHRGVHNLYLNPSLTSRTHRKLS